MSHEVETMMFHGESPWHGLGTRVDHLLTAKEAIAAAGMDWLVEKIQLHLPDGKAVDHYALVRVKDGEIYGYAGKDYKVWNNWEAFQFFDAVTGTGLAKYETAGSLRKGAVIFILANLGNFGVSGEEMKKYCVLSSGHDSQHALRVFWTPVRVVCMNTLRMALSNNAGVYHKHTQSITADSIREAQSFLGLANGFFDTWTTVAQRLSTLALPAPQVPLLLEATFGAIPADSIAAMNWIYTKQRIEELVEVQPYDNAKVKGSRWAWYNAVAQHVDHDMYHTPAMDKSPDRRLEKVWFGEGEAVKQRAWDALNAIPIV
jgi:phage/plasmid-like protein (TIGR03299 family)